MYRWWMFSPLCKDDGIKVQTNRVIDGKSRAMLIRPGPHSVMYGKASCGQFVSEKWGVLCRKGHKEKKKEKKSENKEIIIRGGGRKSPKLVFIVVTLACCYGNSKSHFKDGLGGPWLPSVPCIQWGSPGVVWGWECCLSVCSFLLLLWFAQHLLLFMVSRGLLKELRTGCAGYRQAEKIFKPITWTYWEVHRNIWMYKTGLLTFQIWHWSHVGGSKWASPVLPLPWLPPGIRRMLHWHNWSWEGDLHSVPEGGGIPDVLQLEEARCRFQMQVSLLQPARNARRGMHM